MNFLFLNYVLGEKRSGKEETRRGGRGREREIKESCRNFLEEE